MGRTRMIAGEFSAIQPPYPALRWETHRQLVDDMVKQVTWLLESGMPGGLDEDYSSAEAPAVATALLPVSAVPKAPEHLPLCLSIQDADEASRLADALRMELVSALGGLKLEETTDVDFDVAFLKENDTFYLRVRCF